MLIKCIEPGSKISSGGHSSVFMISPGKTVAKIYKSSTTSLSIHFNEIKEIILLKKLDKKYVVEIIDLIYSPDYFGFTMQYYPMTLRHFINTTRGSILNNDVSRQIIKAVCYLHSAEVIHRDIKPGNILFDPKSSTVKLCDFSFSCWFHDNNKIEKVQTIYYRAPEVLLKKRYTEKIDIWSLGCVIYEIFNNSILFEHTDSYAIINAIISALYVDGLAFSGDNKITRFANSCIESKRNQANSRKIVLKGADNVVSDIVFKSLVIDPEKRISSAEISGIIGKDTRDSHSCIIRPIGAINDLNFPEEIIRFLEITVQILHNFGNSTSTILHTVVFIGEIITAEFAGNYDDINRVALVIMACIVIKQCNEESTPDYYTLIDIFDVNVKISELSATIMMIIDKHSGIFSDGSEMHLGPEKISKKLIEFVDLMIDPAKSGGYSDA